MARMVCQFSCGAASAIATKLTLANHADVLIVNAFLEEEHPDNRRFLKDCEHLRELPPGEGDLAQDGHFHCSFFCQMAENEWQTRNHDTGNIKP